LEEAVITFGTFELEACKLVAGFRNLGHGIFLPARGKDEGKSVVGANLIGQTVGFLVLASAQ
jgi:hypothetical protein